MLVTTFVICWYPMQTVWAQSGLTKCWARSKFKLFDTDAIPERIFIKRRGILKIWTEWQKHLKLALRPFHIHTETEPKPNRNRTEKLKCLKPYGRFHICAETETEPKTNAEPKTCTILIWFFLVSVAEFQQTRQVILIKSAHTQPRALYIT